ncbi:MCE family protein [Prochlorococcus marinus XMU1419]|uniref:MlaD family protein n=1 Tax=Prochlorococcus marinus TaxID=1219 RepID=UPI001ADAC17B|nr:MlaD family protein [Prochlorococcus marinus]MBO8233190.1 MCE family protein [Prochlorococcus marinus XMU1419]MBW3076676.1 MCE family protein [Prochlorococcus marinus str. XMU1419]
MRRSLRDSIVGFSLLGGILIFTLFSFWLRGVRLSSKNWYLFAEFNNASGLSKKSPVTYRGILVGSIEDILFTNESIQAKIVLNNHDIVLPKPAFARVVTNSFLGGDVQVALETSEKSIPKNIAKPASEKCNTKIIVCQGDIITGKQLSSLSNITNKINQLLKVSNQENLIENIVKSIDQFDQTQENLDELIFLSKQEIQRIKPLIKEITTAANHLNNILSTIDDKETLNDIKLTINAAKSISSKLDDMSDDFEKLTKDKELTKSIRDLTIGLSKFFNEIYP